MTDWQLRHASAGQDHLLLMLSTPGDGSKTSVFLPNSAVDKMLDEIADSQPQWLHAALERRMLRQIRREVQDALPEPP